MSIDNLNDAAANHAVTKHNQQKSWWKRYRMWRRLLNLFLFLFILVAINSTLARLKDSWDVGGRSWFSRFQPESKAWQLQRGAAIMDQPDRFNNQYKSVRYLDQGWLPADSLWFYTTTQGSDLIPYDFFMELEQPGTGKLLRSNDVLYDYGYLAQTATSKNPDGLPVGFVKDTYKRKDYLGFSCSACHTGQVNYNGVAIRIDGGPAGSDMENFLTDLAKAMTALQGDANASARAQFVQGVLHHGHYSSAGEVENDLNKFALRLSMYVTVNYGVPHYGYYRLDAFGRIYNRVLEHIITQDQLYAVLQDMVKDGDLTQDEINTIEKKDAANVLTSKERDHLVLRLAETLPAKVQVKIGKRIFNPANAPVSYPYLWDIPQHDYVQWDGLAPNAGLGSVGRNAGEVIGVFATLDWSEQEGFSLAALIGGQGLKWKHISFDSSVDVHNLRRLEHHLGTLKSPVWPEDILGKIDTARAARGEVWYDTLCASCHTRINRSDPDRRIVASITRLKDVRTDSKMAMNAATYEGRSGILRNEYTTSGGGPVLINESAPVAALLTKATLSVVATPRPDKGYVRRGLDWADDLITAFLDNDIKPSIKQGNYDPDTTANPYASLFAYKARPLNGIWATAPYLHNGSVPTLYDLLLPPNPNDAAPGDSNAVKSPPGPPGTEYRPRTFMVGTREFDAQKVGLKTSGYKGFPFNVTFDGNSNGGHEYGTKGFTLPNGDKRGPLTKEERLDLLEFLKTL